MSLDPDTWLAAAQRLPRGKSTRTGHICGSGTCMTVAHEDTGWRAYCHRCSDTGFEPHPQESLQEKLERLEQQTAVEAYVQEDVRPPRPAEHDVTKWPLHAKVWLYKAGLSNVDIKQIGAFYHETTDRVVLTVRSQSGDTVYWQARATQPGRSPKYLNPRVDRSHLVAKYGTGHSITLTEDILSAYRVGQVTEAWGLLGTRLPEYILAELIQINKPVIIWLDPDEPGQKAATKISRQLRAFGLDVRSIVSPKDPKLLTNKEIQAWLSMK